MTQAYAAIADYAVRYHSLCGRCISSLLASLAEEEGLARSITAENKISRELINQISKLCRF